MVKSAFLLLLLTLTPTLTLDFAPSDVLIQCDRMGRSSIELAANGPVSSILPIPFSPDPQNFSNLVKYFEV